MPEIRTQRDDIRAIKDVHLFHFAVSNCSQRVRITLEEKRVPWVDHHVNLLKDEHLTRELQALNPNGVVPVLVHDGRTFVESNDIIEYIDTNFDGPSLQPKGAQDQVFLQETIERSSAIQGALKLVSHEFLFKSARRMNPKQLANLPIEHPTHNREVCGSNQAAPKFHKIIIELWKTHRPTPQTPQGRQIGWYSQDRSSDLNAPSRA